MEKFNFKKGSSTKKGPVPVIRIISKDHTDYIIYQKALKLAGRYSGPVSAEELKAAEESLNNSNGRNSDESIR